MALREFCSADSETTHNCTNKPKNINHAALIFHFVCEENMAACIKYVFSLHSNFIRKQGIPVSNDMHLQ
jgi:uncharacterized protein involved in tolerance to divalent cations